MKKLLFALTLLLATLNSNAQEDIHLSCPDDNHPHAIDLGLPSGTKWACCNVGATTPEGYGGYYAWGEIKEKEVYNEVTYQYCTGTDTDGDGKYDKNCNYQNLGIDIAGTQYDVAHIKWDDSWVSPSHEQLMELFDNTTSKWTTMNGINGWLFTGFNGGSVFFPAAGHRWYDKLEGVGITGIYWSSTQSPSDSDDVFTIYFGSDFGYWGFDIRVNGHCVRPVLR